MLVASLHWPAHPSHPLILVRPSHHDHGYGLVKHCDSVLPWRMQPSYGSCFFPLGFYLLLPCWLDYDLLYDWLHASSQETSLHPSCHVRMLKRRTCEPSWWLDYG